MEGFYSPRKRLIIISRLSRSVNISVGIFYMKIFPKIKA